MYGMSLCVKALNAAPVRMIWWGILYYSLQLFPSSPRSPLTAIRSVINYRAYVGFQIFFINFGIT